MDSDEVGIGCLLLVGFLVLAAAGVAFYAWIIMLLQGALAPHFGWDTWSFGLSMLVSLAFSAVTGAVKGTAS